MSDGHVLPSEPPGPRLPMNGWHAWVGAYPGVAVITLAARPLAALTVYALSNRRRAT